MGLRSVCCRVSLFLLLLIYRYSSYISLYIGYINILAKTFSFSFFVVIEAVVARIVIAFLLFSHINRNVGPISIGHACSIRSWMGVLQRLFSCLAS